MSRFARPSFRFADLDVLPSGRKNRRLFDWWCDDEGNDRQHLLRELRSRSPYEFPSCAPVQNDPAPPLDQPARQGHAEAYLVSDPEQVRMALAHSTSYSNIPYAGLGGASFMLAMDPVTQGRDWHHEQREALKTALSEYGRAGLRQLGVLAVDQAALTGLRSADFDLALFAEQAALRFFGQLFGFGFQDYALLQDAARAAYRALQYLAFGQHFVSEPGTLVNAQTALGKLATRAGSLMEEYEYRRRSPRRYGMKGSETWPEGVQPWSDVGLEIGLGQPLLARIACVRTPLSHRDLATIVACSIAGTLGNVQSAVCSLTAEALRDDVFRAELQRAGQDDASLERWLEDRLCRLPPVSVIPRRTLKEVRLGDKYIPPGTDCLLLLETPPGARPPEVVGACPHVWGDVSTGSAAHACLGRMPASVLMAQIVKRTLRLPGLKRSLDPLTGEVLPMRRLWGIACTQFPLRFDRERERAQQNLIVAMRVKPPISENAARLRRLIEGSVPRIEHLLVQFGGVHFAWFEFTDDDSQLVLRTLYDGQFEAYISHFARHAGDLFDGLFEFLEGAPQRPVAEHPHEFVEAIRRFNRAPLAGYLFSAYPKTSAMQITGRHAAVPPQKAAAQAPAGPAGVCPHPPAARPPGCGSDP